MNRVGHTAAVLLLASTPAGAADALTRGLVITENSDAGETRQMYVGNLYRMLLPDGSGTIIDLSKNLVTILDSSERTASVGAVQDAMEFGMLGLALGLIQVQPPKPLGVHRKILNHDCEQYEARAVVVFPVSVSYCLSTTAPGAAVVREFNRKLLARLPEGQGKKLLDSIKSGVVMASESSFGDASQVTRIEENGQVSPAMFKVPAGYQTQPLQDLLPMGGALR